MAKTRFTLTIDEDLLKRLKMGAVHYDINTSEFILELIENAIFENNEYVELMFPDRNKENL